MHHYTQLSKGLFGSYFGGFGVQECTVGLARVSNEQSGTVGSGEKYVTEHGTHGRGAKQSGPGLYSPS